MFLIDETSSSSWRNDAREKIQDDDYNKKDFDRDTRRNKLEETDRYRPPMKWSKDRKIDNRDEDLNIRDRRDNRDNDRERDRGDRDRERDRPRNDQSVMPRVYSTIKDLVININFTISVQS